ncbi:hypothetical protein [Avibacterium paragallinarum]|uniref:hypothetical protein n=1 Tax=Avibacterium paragallinarum TaxID=728 RepID=UPI0010291D08|nr:hypothetical protein [Avibacterium paragallinarum]RZN59111.1 hypothetical protein EIG78_02550 [Avibacterium paragallinarum]
MKWENEEENSVFTTSELRDDPETFITDEHLRRIFLKKNIICNLLQVPLPRFKGGLSNREQMQTYSRPENDIERQLREENKRIKDELAKAKEREKIYKEKMLTQDQQTTNAIIDKVTYNPSQRRTHQKIIYALLMARTNKDFSATAYFKANGDLKVSTISQELVKDMELSGIAGFSAETFRKELANILKLEETQQAD